MGVFLEEQPREENVTDRATWRHTDGLEQIAPGEFKPLRTGTHYISVGVRKEGQWITDTIKMVVE